MNMIEWTGTTELNVPPWRDMPYEERMTWIAASVRFWFDYI